MSKRKSKGPSSERSSSSAPVELSSVIGMALDQIAKVRDESVRKKDYLVDEVVVELYLRSTEGEEGRVKFQLFDFGLSGKANADRVSAHKVTIKLKPKKKSSVPDASNG